MTKKRKSIITYVILIVLFILICGVLPRLASNGENKNATNYINSIKMDVCVNSDGSASVEEVWDTSIFNGTELYKPYGVLGKSYIQNLSVSDSNGNKYSYIDEWNVDSSFKQKAFKCGIVRYTTTELCWGISKYGNNTYTISYDITNFIDQYVDGQGINFSFMPDKMNPCPKDVVITIRSDEMEFTKENSKIWAFACQGATINFDSGKIVMNANNNFSPDKRMVVLALWEKNTFNTGNIIEKTIKEVQDEALGEVKDEIKEDEKKEEEKTFGGQTNPTGRSLYSNWINSISYYIHVNNDGSAKVTETWKVKVNEGDQLYRIYPKQLNSTISNLQVTDDKEAVYEVYDSWDYVTSSRKLKENKCALINRNSENEIIWGVGELGDRTYIISYDLTSFIYQFSDGQGILFRFFPFIYKNQLGTLKDINIVISSDIPFSQDNCSSQLINAKDGNLTYVNGNIMVNCKYGGEVILQTFFNEDMFEIKEPVDYSKTELIEALANKYGKTKEDDVSKDGGIKEFFSSVAFKIIALVVGFMLFDFLLICLGMRINNKAYYGINQLSKKDLKQLENAGYYREIPLNGDLVLSYWFAGFANISSDVGRTANLIGAFILKWMKEKRITLNKNNTLEKNESSKQYSLNLELLNASEEDTIENQLIGLFKKAAGENNTLDPKEFEEWNLAHCSEINTWLSNVRNYSVKEINLQKFKTLDVLKQLKGLKNYLLDFSTMPEKIAEDVVLWEDYLIYGQLLGIADKVQEQFKELYPQIWVIIKTTNVDCIITDKFITERTINEVKTRYYEETHPYSSSSSGSDSSDDRHSSGSGGSSFSGGGSSSRGGSSGGGVR